MDFFFLQSAPLWLSWVSLWWLSLNPLIVIVTLVESDVVLKLFHLLTTKIDSPGGNCGLVNFSESEPLKWQTAKYNLCDCVLSGKTKCP